MGGEGAKAEMRKEFLLGAGARENLRDTVKAGQSGTFGRSSEDREMRFETKDFVPRLCWPHGASRKPKVHVPPNRHGGARFYTHCGNHSLWGGLWQLQGILIIYSFQLFYFPCIIIPWTEEPRKDSQSIYPNKILEYCQKAVESEESRGAGVSLP